MTFLQTVRFLKSSTSTTTGPPPGSSDAAAAAGAAGVASARSLLAWRPGSGTLVAQPARIGRTAEKTKSRYIFQLLCHRHFSNASNRTADAQRCESPARAGKQQGNDRNDRRAPEDD